MKQKTQSDSILERLKRKEQLIAALEERILIIDGAMGTMLQQMNLTESDYSMNDEYRQLEDNIPLKGNNDFLSLTRPEIIYSIHREYLESGADIIETNSFNSNCIVQKDYQCQHLVRLMNLRSASIAKNACEDFQRSNPNCGPKFVAGSLGPTNKTLSISPRVDDPSYRDCEWDELVDCYREQASALLDGGVDIILLETVIDTANAKAALFAIRSVLNERNLTDLVPVFVSATIVDKSGRLLSGQTIDAFVISVEHSEPLVFGLNCALGPDEMAPFIKRLSRFVRCRYLICYPNAGLPNVFGLYDQTPDRMASQLKRFAEEGYVNIVGGCCGTTTKHIKAISDACKTIKPRRISPKAEQFNDTYFAGLESFVHNQSTLFVNIGERCNMAGCKRFAQLIHDRNHQEALELAREQVENGAQLLDINLDDAMIDGPKEMRHFLNLLATEPEICRIPVCIDSSRFDVIEQGLKCCQGKGIVNSISLKLGEEEFCRQARLIKEFGFAVIVMAFDEQGQATEIADKIQICQRSFRILRKIGFKPNHIIFDPNILTVGTGLEEHNNYAVNYIKSIEKIKKTCPGCHIIGGVSNISFAFRGMNQIREAMHSVFLYHAIKSGMDMGIVNAGSLRPYTAIDPTLRDLCEDLILNRCPEATEKLLQFAKLIQSDGDQIEKEISSLDDWRQFDVESRLKHSIINGLDQWIHRDIEECRKNCERYPKPLQIIEGPLMNAMGEVGDLFGDGKMFLPQVIKSARVMKKAVSFLVPFIERSSGLGSKQIVPNQKTIVLATVKGDVHDIGKNIVAVVLGCNNYNVIDLGVMVPSEKIIDAIKNHRADIVGLSGLITPSLDEMITVAKEMEQQGIRIPLIIGGATTSKRHTAIKIAPNYSGAVVHCIDASKSVWNCSKLLSDNLEDREEFLEEIEEEYDEIRLEYEENTKQQQFLSYEQAKKQKYRLDFDRKLIKVPRFFGTKSFLNYDLNLLRPYIDWKPFFDCWQLRGRYPNRNYPNIFNDQTVGNEARKLFDEAQTMIDWLVAKNQLRANAIIGFYRANSINDEDIVILNENDQTIGVLHGIRQQHRKESDSDQDSNEYLSIADFIAPKETGIDDFIGLFVVSAGFGLEEICDGLQQKNDVFGEILVKAIADRFAEAFAEHLHERVRKEFWGYVDDERLSTVDLLKVSYEGIRPAPGYPSQPDHTEKLTIWNLMNVESETGMKLTESLSIWPSSSCCGIYFSHPKSKYFAVGKLAKDQIVSYAKRKNQSIEFTEKSLRMSLGY
ncbi:BTB/POZ domain-containing protein KCTD12 [Sarcoptes scabiei]|nr:BTB/POZ domain-containing protein KCTD12 [Sarcoptes scabiei]